MELTVEHRHHRDGPEECFGCRIKSISLSIPYRDAFHNSTLAEQERQIRKDHPNAERIR